MAKPRGLHTTDNSYGFSSRCPECNTADPQTRAKHQLDEARLGGLDGLRAHLTEQYVQQREPEHQRPDLVDDVCRWVANLIEQFSHMADPDTGHTMSWWEARAYMAAHKDQIAETARNRAPEKTKFSAPAPEVNGFTRVPETPSFRTMKSDLRAPRGHARRTPFPEEHAYEGTTRILELDEQDYTQEQGEDDSMYANQEGA